MVSLKAEVMVLLDTIQAAEVGGEEPGPISGRHDGTTILGPDQLADVTCRGLLDHTGQVVQGADVGSAKLPLDEAETGIRGELSVASNHEVQMDGLVQTSEHSPHEVLHHGVILVLATAVVSMQTGGGFAETMMAEKKSSMLTTVFAPLPVSLASSITKFTCRGMASQHTPKMAAFLGVKK